MSVEFVAVDRLTPNDLVTELRRVRDILARPLCDDDGLTPRTLRQVCRASCGCRDVRDEAVKRETAILKRLLAATPPARSGAKRGKGKTV